MKRISTVFFAVSAGVLTFLAFTTSSLPLACAALFVIGYTIANEGR